jgi:hypothetical protein
MNKPDLSIIIPSIRVNNLEALPLFIDNSIGPYSYEMVVVSPYSVPDQFLKRDNVKIIKDLGSPGRCVQIGSMVAEGEYLCWLSDDCTFLSPNGLAQSISILQNKTEKDVVCLRYFEGDGPGEFDLNYWTAWTHDSLRLQGIKKDWKCAPLGMYNTKYFRHLGGLDCSYEHINMNTHDLAFRAQNNGGEIILSPKTVARFFWSWHNEESKPIQEAWFKNDKDRFASEWSKNQSQRIHIDYMNWTNAESKWSRRFGN